MLNAEQKKYLSQLSKKTLIDFVSEVYGIALHTTKKQKKSVKAKA